MGELCPGAVLETAAVPPPLDLFPWSPPIEPGAHRPAPPELPDHEDLSRTGSEWAVPRRRAGAGGRAPAEISWSSNPPPSPSPSPCPQPPPSRTSVRASGSSAAGRSLPRPRAAGGSCAPPRGDLQPVHPSSPRLPASGRGLRTDRRDAAPGAPALSRTPCRAGRRRACIEADKVPAVPGGAPCWSRWPCPRRDSVVPRIHLRAPAHRPALNHPFLERRGGAVLPPRDLRIHPRAAAHQSASTTTGQSASLCE